MLYHKHFPLTLTSLQKQHYNKYVILQHKDMPQFDSFSIDHSLAQTGEMVINAIPSCRYTGS